MVKWAAVRAAGPSLLVGSSPSSGQRADPTVATTVTASGKLAAMRGLGRWLDWLGAHLTLRVIVIAHHTRLPFGSLYNVQRGIINRQRSVDFNVRFRAWQARTDPLLRCIGPIVKGFGCRPHTAVPCRPAAGV